MRIFKTSVFARWANKNHVTDAALRRAIREVEAGLVDAELGAGLCKKRIPMPGRGKRGGGRCILAFRARRRAYFLHGFAKGARDNVTKREREALRRLARELLGYSEAGIRKALDEGVLIEVDSDDE